MPSADPSDHVTFEYHLQTLEARFNALQPELELTVRDPAVGVEGYVVVWSTLGAVDGPLGRVGKGGTRITPNVTLDEIKMLARVMTLKNSAAGLPLGGAKSGLRADPSLPAFERSYRRFVHLVKPVLAENGGPFGGFGFDIGGRPEHALWACEELGTTRSFTGKPVHLGGTDYDREGIAGLGVVVAAKTLTELEGSNLRNKSYAVQGLGAMGAAIVRYLSQYGCEMRAISDPRLGGTFVFRTPPSKEILGAIEKHDFEGLKTLLSSATSTPLPLDEVLYADVDLLFPAAVQDVLTGENVAKVHARAVIEAANGPLDAAARRALFERGIFVMPDIIANPGGIIAAFVEMTAPDGDDKVVLAKKMAEERIRANVTRLYQLATSLKAEPARVALYIALRNVFKD